MSLFNKTKKSLDSILGVFNKAYHDLQEWEEVTLEEQREIEARIKLNKEQLAQVETAKEALKPFIKIN